MEFPFPVPLQVGAFASAIFACLAIQLFNYLGYKQEARSLYGQSKKSWIQTKVSKIEDAAIFWFVCEDKAIGVAAVLFVVGVGLSAVTYWVLY